MQFWRNPFKRNPFKRGPFKRGPRLAAQPMQTADLYSGGIAAELPPQPSRRKMRFLPVWQLIFFVYFMLLVRILAMANMGPGTYADRIETLNQGNKLERVAAVVMYMDPVSEAMAYRIRRGLKNWTAYTRAD